MHELSIALSIVDGVEEELNRRGEEQVYAVHLRLGRLAGVVKEALLFSYELACEGTPLAGSRLIVEEIPVRVYCTACAMECDTISDQCLQCVTCGGSNCRLVRGSELELASLELFELSKQAH